MEGTIAVLVALACWGAVVDSHRDIINDFGPLESQTVSGLLWMIQIVVAMFLYWGMIVCLRFGDGYCVGWFGVGYSFTLNAFSLAPKESEIIHVIFAAPNLTQLQRIIVLLGTALCS